MSTPSAPDVDQPEGGAHGGEDEQGAAGRTPDITDNDNDVPDGGDASGS